MEEASGLEPVQCGFESHCRYHFQFRVAQLVEATDLSSVECEFDSRRGDFQEFEPDKRAGRVC